MSLKEKVCGIYRIVNNINNKCYVGKAKDIHHRFWSHKNNSSRALPDRRSSPLLFHAFKKYGIESFTFEILEILETDETLLSNRELYWMDYYNSYDRCCGYNLRRDSSTGMIVSKETSDKISARLINEWRSGIRDGHSEKLKNNWENNEERKISQSNLMSKALTKYKYELFDLNGVFLESVLYKDLKTFGLNNCGFKFHRNSSNEIIYKGYIIKRVNYLF